MSSLRFGTAAWLAHGLAERTRIGLEIKRRDFGAPDWEFLRAMYKGQNDVNALVSWLQAGGNVRTACHQMGSPR